MSGSWIRKWSKANLKRHSQMNLVTNEQPRRKQRGIGEGRFGVVCSGASMTAERMSNTLGHILGGHRRAATDCRLNRWGLFLALLFTALSPADAHPETNPYGGFLAGIRHPVTGLDHVVAMVAVGLWGVSLGAPAIWLLPVVFPLVMAFGGACGVLGGPLPGVEEMIAASGIVLGLVVTLSARPPLWVASVIVGFFAFFHGYSHGVELPHTANPFTYAAGFVIATGLLHLSGISIGLLTRWPWGKVIVRALGSVIMAIGFAFLFGFL